MKKLIIGILLLSMILLVGCQVKSNDYLEGYTKCAMEHAEQCDKANDCETFYNIPPDLWDAILESSHYGCGMKEMASPDRLDNGTWVDNWVRICK